MGKLKNIAFSLDDYKIMLQFHGSNPSLTLQFDTPSRRFYFSVIVLVVLEMKKKGAGGFVHIHRYKRELKQLDKALSGKHASKNTDGMWAKINMAWRHRLPDLESAALFKVLDRDLIQPYEKGGKYRTECSESECDTWANLFGYDDNNKWRFKFAIESVSIGFDDVAITLGKLRDDLAWNTFVTRLNGQTAIVPQKMKRVPVWWKHVALVLVVLLIVGFASFTILTFYLRPVTPTTALQLSGKPSIAVLPFSNLSEDPDQMYFSDGISEEIITALSKTQQLLVIARNSSFSYRGRSIKVQKIAAELGVRYVLEGSARKADGKVRITAQLIDALSGHHIWAERYERRTENLFVVQDEIAMQIITALHVELAEGQEAIIFAKGTDSLEAYLKCLQARELITNTTREGYWKARQLLEEALKIDPNYCQTYRMLGAIQIIDIWLGLSKSPEESIQRGIQYFQKAIALDETSGTSYASMGYLLLLAKQYDRAIAAVERALDLEPNSTDVLFHYASVLTYTGRPKEAVNYFRAALRRNPIPPNTYLRHMGTALRHLGQYDEAIALQKRAVKSEPDDIFAYLILTALYTLTGRQEEARSMVKEVLRIDPDFSVARLGKALPYKDPENTRRAIDILHQAGLPD